MPTVQTPRGRKPPATLPELLEDIRRTGHGVNDNAPKTRRTIQSLRVEAQKQWEERGLAHPAHVAGREETARVARVGAAPPEMGTRH